MIEQTMKCDGCKRALDGEGLPIPMAPTLHCCSLECVTDAISARDPSFPAFAKDAATAAAAKAKAKADGLKALAAQVAAAQAAPKS